MSNGANELEATLVVSDSNPEIVKDLVLAILCVIWEHYIFGKSNRHRAVSQIALFDLRYPMGAAIRPGGRACRPRSAQGPRAGESWSSIQKCKKPEIEPYGRGFAPYTSEPNCSSIC